MLSLYWIEFSRSWVLFKRYPMDALAAIFMLLFLFCGLFYGAEYLTNGTSHFGERLETMVVMYINWILVIGVFSGLSGEIQREADTGTLEQLFMARLSMPNLILVRAFANLGVNFLITILTLQIVIWVSGVELNYAAIAIVPVIASVFAGIGLGMMTASITLLAKKAMGFIAMLQLLLIVVMVLPFESWSSTGQAFGYLLPITSATSQLKSIMAGSDATLGLPHLYSLLSGLSYLVAGYLIFRCSVNRAKRLGNLSQY
ncbi:ABC transporter permease [Ningiella sp. W23]|uniref:ABC transporter permease n=1 Tax=Ningiella sp. W23 TaxID=3023715 RepID=UPI0037563690